jgi:hypothetical protein
LDTVRSNLANHAVTMEAFMTEVDNHHGDFANFTGFVIKHSRTFRSRTAKAIAAPAENHVVRPEDKCEECGCRLGTGIKLMPDKTWVACRCARSDYLKQQRDRGVVIADARSDVA